MAARPCASQPSQSASSWAFRDDFGLRGGGQAPAEGQGASRATVPRSKVGEAAPSPGWASNPLIRIGSPRFASLQHASPQSAGAPRDCRLSSSSRSSSGDTAHPGGGSAPGKAQTPPRAERQSGNATAPSAPGDTASRPAHSSSATSAPDCVPLRPMAHGVAPRLTSPRLYDASHAGSQRNASSAGSALPSSSAEPCAVWGPMPVTRRHGGAPLEPQSLVCPPPRMVPVAGPGVQSQLHGQPQVRRGGSDVGSYEQSLRAKQAQVQRHGPGQELPHGAQPWEEHPVVEGKGGATQRHLDAILNEESPSREREEFDGWHSCDASPESQVRQISERQMQRQESDFESCYESQRGEDDDVDLGQLDPDQEEYGELDEEQLLQGLLGGGLALHLPSASPQECLSPEDRCAEQVDRPHQKEWRRADEETNVEQRQGEHLSEACSEVQVSEELATDQGDAVLPIGSAWPLPFHDSHLFVAGVVTQRQPPVPRLRMSKGLQEGVQGGGQPVPHSSGELPPLAEVLGEVSECAGPSGCAASQASTPEHRSPRLSQQKPQAAPTVEPGREEGPPEVSCSRVEQESGCRELEGAVAAHETSGQKDGPLAEGLRARPAEQRDALAAAAATQPQNPERCPEERPQEAGHEEPEICPEEKLGAPTATSPEVGGVRQPPSLRDALALAKRDVSDADSVQARQSLPQSTAQPTKSDADFIVERAGSKQLERMKSTGSSVGPVRRMTSGFVSERGSFMLKRFQRRVFASCGDCLEGCLSFVTPPKDWSLERDHFERTIKFLQSVPLFKHQLPACELPMIASQLTRITWQPGQVVIRQGEVGRAFFLIRSGEALVQNEDNESTEEIVLYPGDYFGEHSLLSARQNVATIICKGPAPLVTMSMSRAVWDTSGLSKHLRIGKRPHLARARTRAKDGGRAVDRTKEEQDFIIEAIKRNPNLRALGECRLMTICDIAAIAERRTLLDGEAAAIAGEIGQEFFVIASGAFDVIVPPSLATDVGQRSAEAVMATSTMADRLRRKQCFLQELHRSTRTPTTSRSKAASAVMKAVRSATSPKSPTTTSPKDGDFVVRRGNVKRARHQSIVMNEDGAEVPSPRPGGIVSSKFSDGQLVICLELPEGERSAGKNGNSLLGLAKIPLRPRCAQETPHFSGVARVVGARPNERVEVEVESGGRMVVDAELLRPYQDSQVLMRLRPGESFGEWSLLYNTRCEATFLAREESVVYAIGQDELRHLLSRRGPRFDEAVTLLGEVKSLSGLLRSQRWELARARQGLVNFAADEPVIIQGKVREARLWYVIESGSVVLQRDCRQVNELYRADCFGERSLLHNTEEPIEEFTAVAGARGVCCLTFDGDLVRTLLETVFAGMDDESAVMRVPSERSKGMSKTRARSEVKLESLRSVRFLGRGGFGSVALVTEVSKPHVQYALKKMSKGLIKESEMQQQVCWERDLLLMVDSPFIIRLYRTFRDSTFVYFLMEAALGGDLYKLLRSRPELFNADQPKGWNTGFYVACIILGLEHMHERHIVFRDLKPENVLLDARGYGKLCDMGFARFVLGKTNTLAGTPEYMAPELIQFPHAHDMKVDWWSLGVLTFELSSGQTPFEDEGVADPHEKLLAIHRSQSKGEPRYPFGCTSHLKSFISRLLKPVSHRLGSEGGAREVRRHSWFQRLSLDFSALRDLRLKSPFRPEPAQLPTEDELEGLSIDVRRQDSGCSDLYRVNEDDNDTWDADF